MAKRRRATDTGSGRLDLPGKTQFECGNGHGNLILPYYHEFDKTFPIGCLVPDTGHSALLGCRS